MSGKIYRVMKFKPTRFYGGMAQLLDKVAAEELIEKLGRENKINIDRISKFLFIAENALWI